MKLWHGSLIAAVVPLTWLSTAFAASNCPPTPCSNVPGVNRNGEYVIKDVCDLEGIENDLSADYQLVNNIDATCTIQWTSGTGGGFIPLPGSFSGKLEGNGHWVNGLFISSSLPQVGVFQTLSSGTVDNVAFTNARVSGTASEQQVGVVAGQNGGTISFVYVTGAVSTAPSNFMALGGVTGYNAGTVTFSYSAATILPGSGGNNNANYTDGGLVGLNRGLVSYSLASGNIPQAGGDAGGLVGFNGNAIIQSGAIGQSATSPNGAMLGGLVGWNQNGRVEQSYSSGSLNAPNAEAGGLVDLDDAGGQVDQSYAVGATAGNAAGGLISRTGQGGETVTASYWNIQTTGQTTSSGGAPFSTSATGFLNVFPTDFSQNVWSWVAFSPGDSYSSLPFIFDFNCLWGGALATNCARAMSNPNNRDLSCKDGSAYFCSTVPPIMSLFEPPLSQLILTANQVNTHAGVYTVIPVGQKQLFEYTSIESAETKVIYSGKVYAAASVACAGTAYSMVARLVGSIYPTAQVTPNRDNLCGVESEPAAGAHIDCMLDKNGNGFWPNSLNAYAKIKTGGALNDSDVEAKIALGQPVILHGVITNTGNGSVFDHFVVATSVINSGGAITRLVVNDPEVGMQMFIDMNPADGAGIYHHAVFNPAKQGNLKNFEKLTGFDLQVDVLPSGMPGTYAYFVWQNHN